MSDFSHRRFNADPGDTLYFSRYGEQTPHLYVVVTAPYGNPSCVVIVNLTTKQLHSDTTVVLRSSDHPFINRETVVNYSQAVSVTVERLMGEIEDGIAEPREPLPASVLQAIQQGMLRSPRAPRDIKAHCRRMWKKKRA